MTKKFYYLLLLVLICIGTTLKFAHTHEAMPIGCDEFGYLNLAKYFDEGKTVDRSYLPGLLEHLRTSGITEPELSWMVTPHAYHVIPGTNTVINQYPPGTSFLLSLLPFEWRNLLFPLLAMFTLILIPAVGIRITNFRDWNLFDLTFPVLLFLITVSTPFITELSRVNSLAVTFGLLLAAGMVLFTRPNLACFLIALTVNFRVVNILMTLPVFLFLPILVNLNKEGIIQNFKMFFKACCLILISVLPVLFYNYSITGNPLASTYSVIDTAMNDGAGIMKNIEYYFSTKQHWFLVHLAALIVLSIFCIYKKLSWFTYFKILAFPVINYIFFFWHKVTMDYYPYASSMILVGITIGLAKSLSFKGKFRFIIPVTGILAGLVVLISGYKKFQKKEHLTLEQAKLNYASLCEYDIVWSDLLSGTTEYVCGNNGFRYSVTTPRARISTIKYLQAKNFKQVILLDDVPEDAMVVAKELEGAGVGYISKTDAKRGRMLEIPGIDLKEINR